jgi:two-component system NarL family sensor kinase
MRRLLTARARASRDALDLSRRGALTRLVVQFSFAGVAALVVVGLATWVASQRVGERQAISDARTTTLVKAQGLVEPVVTDGLATGQAAAVARIAPVVTQRVLDTNLVRVKIWTRSGEIVYSDEPRLVGTTYPLGDDEVDAIDKGVIAAQVSDLSAPENRFERNEGKLLEVYLPIRTPSGDRLLFEAYYRYDAVAAAGRQIWRSFAPISLGALVALELVQVPLAFALARRLRDRQRERERLLQQTINASENERRRIASDLHDGVVQDLAGVAYSLAGSSRTADLPPPAAALLDRSATQVQASIKSLRTLLVDIYPPKLAEAGLDSVLTDLLAGVSARGVATSCDTDELGGAVPEPIAALLYRVAQEALRNVVTHAHASSVHLRAASNHASVMLEVVDDGVGFDADVAEARAREGHLGLRGIADRVRDAGGEMDVSSAPGAGTTVRMTVPLA